MREEKKNIYIYINWIYQNIYIILSQSQAQLKFSWTTRAPAELSSEITNTSEPELTQYTRKPFVSSQSEPKPHFTLMDGLIRKKERTFFILLSLHKTFRIEVQYIIYTSHNSVKWINRNA
jgi:hypothetical protein